MYERFFGLRERPFDLRPDPSFLYLAERHVTALTMLQYGLFEQDGFAVITGEVGSGKTTLLRYLLDRLDNGTEVGVISNTHESFGSLMPWVALAFGLDYKQKGAADLHETFADFANAQHAARRKVVLLVDEAQNLSVSAIEELRLLSNMNVDKSDVIHVALIGQPELKKTLSRPELVQFRQRISATFHLSPLSSSETRGYIVRRLEVAGRVQPLFTDAASRAVHHASGGIPRLINVLCDTALVYAYAEQQGTIDVSTVEQVVNDRRATGLLVVADAPPSFDAASPGLGAGA